jgi:aminocarboxymuconate-semialdehyde decarboxylase
MRTVDIHGHFLPPACLREIRRHDQFYGISIITTPQEEEYISVKSIPGGPRTEQRIPLLLCQYEAGEILKDMDAKGLELRALSPMQFLFFYWVEAGDALELIRLVNDASSDFTRNHDRLIPMGILPMQNIDLAISEMERIVEKLGMRAVEIGTHFGDIELDDPRLSPFYEKAQEMNILLFVHPYDVLGMDRMGDYFLRNLAGNPFETALVISRIIFGGVIARHPKLKLLFSHGGGAISSILGRLDHGYAQRKECRRNIQKPPSEYMKSLYFDTVTFNKDALELIVKIAGPQNIVLGTDYPFDMMESDPISFIEGTGFLSEKETSKIRGENALRLLNFATSL